MTYPAVSYTITNGNPNDGSQVKQNFDDVVNGVIDGTKEICVSCLSSTGDVTIAGFAKVTGDIYTVAATNYSASVTQVGWAAAGLTCSVYYKKIGKLVIVWFNISGTSDDTSVQFTGSPYTRALDVHGTCYGYDSVAGRDGGIYHVWTSTPNIINIDHQSATNWSATGNKMVKGQIMYYTA